MRELDRVLRDLAESGRVGGAERLIGRLQQRLAGEPAPIVTIGRVDVEKPKAGLTGRKGLLIAAAGLVVGGKAPSLRAGIVQAAESIDSGAAASILQRLARLTQELGSHEVGA